MRGTVGGRAGKLLNMVQYRYNYVMKMLGGVKKGVEYGTIQLCNHSKHRKRKVWVTRRKTHATYSGQHPVPVQTPRSCHLLLDTKMTECHTMMMMMMMPRRDREKVGTVLWEEKGKVTP